MVAVGLNNSGQCDVADWADIVQVAAGYYHTVGVASNGTAVTAGFNTDGQCNVDDWNLN
jgi:alpha-tubulin suppressor-like RCC1 family protein